MQTFFIDRDPGQQTSYAIPQSDEIHVAALTAETEGEVTVPEGARLVVFSATDDFYCRFDADAEISVPSAAVTDGSGPELNPGVRLCDGVTTISLVAPRACNVTLSFYS
jgi:hypothetical protein